MLLQEYYDGVNEGGFYMCDKCEVVKLSPEEFVNHIQYQFHYCELCWNYIHLKKGKCEECGSSFTRRNERPLGLEKCSCGNEVQMTW